MLILSHTEAITVEKIAKPHIHGGFPVIIIIIIIILKRQGILQTFSCVKFWVHTDSVNALCRKDTQANSCGVPQHI